MPDDHRRRGARSPIVEGFAIRLIDRTARTRTRRHVRQIFGAGWRMRPYGDEGTHFELTASRRPSVARAWEATYRLRAIPGVVRADPLFAFVVPASPTEQGWRTAGGRMPNGQRHIRGSADPKWSVNHAGVVKAWRRFPSIGAAGAHIVLGHPDTGYLPHPDIVGIVDAGAGYNFVEGNRDTLDPLKREPGEVWFNPGHGTGTASVFGSPADGQGVPAPGVWGVAPGAKVVPLRVTESVVLVSSLHLAHALVFAADHGCHVVSISLGLPWASPHLLDAVLYAERRGVIVCAAAGNIVALGIHYVVWPAKYAQVVSVAASNANDLPWTRSCHGAEVQVTAPGESVWRAVAERAPSGRGVAYRVTPGSGTSYAVAAVAGIAAMWLSYHGRSVLVAKYSADKLAAVFSHVLRSTCKPEPTWRDGFGAGLVNADAVLAAALPAAAGAALSRPAMPLSSVLVDAGGIDTYLSLFPPGPVRRRRLQGAFAAAWHRAAVSDALAALLNVSAVGVADPLAHVGQELAFQLVTDERRYQLFQRLVRETGRHNRSVVSRHTSAGTTARQLRALLRRAPVSSHLRARLRS